MIFLPAWLALLLLGLFSSLLLVSLSGATEACPFGNGGPSGVNEVKAGIFDQYFWPRAAATLAPFPVLAGIVALIYFGPLRFRRSRQEAAVTRGLPFRPGLKVNGV